ncbi:hypothetical protein AgCh_025449 [Apium graveolens]
MSLRIKTVVDKFVEELKEALDADMQDRVMKEREMQSYIQEREREVAEREAAWKAELSRRERKKMFRFMMKSFMGKEDRRVTYDTRELRFFSRLSFTDGRRARAEPARSMQKEFGSDLGYLSRSFRNSIIDDEIMSSKSIQ